MTFDHSFDVIIVGSGGGGHIASLVAKNAGLDVVVLEKTEVYGGSTALSGGGIWAPNNHLSQKGGVVDSFDNALTYLNSTVGDKVDMEKKKAFLNNAPQMIAWLSELGVKLQHIPGYSDYHPDRAGAVTTGRAVESKPFNAKKLKGDFKKLRTGDLSTPVYFTIKEFSKLIMIKSTWAAKLVAVRAGFRAFVDFILRKKSITLGGALIAQLRYATKKMDVPFWLETPLKELIVENNKVIGVISEQNGKDIRIEAKKAVILSAGGFPHNLEMREKYMPKPQSTAWTSAASGNTGDAIRAGMAIGANVDLMEDAWWGPSSVTPDGNAFFHVSERAYPGSIMINEAGRRYVNEAASYVEVGHEMYEKHSEENKHVPSHIIFDHKYKNKYIFGLTFPGMKFPGEYYDTGYVIKADTIADLAEKIGVDKNSLVETVEKFNKSAIEGKDPEFHRGENAYDNFYGDPKNYPNPNLRPLNVPPYYAVKMYPGDLGTKGGLLTNEHGQVLRSDGSIINGLYATGNTMASVMGNYYPGPGSAVGSTMTFGYIAAHHIIKEYRSQNK